MKKKKIFFVLALLISISFCTENLAKADGPCVEKINASIDLSWHLKDVNILGKSGPDNPVLRETAIANCELLSLYAGILIQQNLGSGIKAPGSYSKYLVGAKPEFANLKLDFAYLFTRPNNFASSGANEFFFKISSPKFPFYNTLDYVALAKHREAKIIFAQRFGIEDNIWLLHYDLHASISHGSRFIGSGLTSAGIGIWLPIKWKDFTIEPYYSYEMTMPKFKGNSKKDIGKKNPNWWGFKIKFNF